MARIDVDNIAELLKKGHIIETKANGKYAFRTASFPTLPIVADNEFGCSEGWDILAIGAGDIMATMGGMLAQYITTQPGIYYCAHYLPPSVNWAILRKED